MHDLTDEILRDLHTMAPRGLYERLLFGPRYRPVPITDCALCCRMTTQTTLVDRRHQICSACLPAYPVCEVCDQRSSSNRTLPTRQGEGLATACSHCRERLFHPCATCGYWTENGTECCESVLTTADNSCCTSPAMDFTVRNDGEAPVSNDSPFEVTLPGGEVSDVGINEIRRLLYRERLFTAYEIAPSLGSTWVTREGTWTRRLSRAVYRVDKSKITDQVMSTIGNLARDHTPEAKAYDLEITRNLNLSAADFGHAGSCYWNGYTRSRCTLKTNGAFAIRSFTNEEVSTQRIYAGAAGCDCSEACRAETARRAAPIEGPETRTVRTVSGRVWVQPVRFARTLWHSTFNTEDPDGFVVFNGYGDLQGYTPVRLLAHMTGLTYRKIEFTMGEAYINAGGYLVAPEALTNVTGSIHLTAPRHANLHQVEAQSPARV